MVGVNGTSTVSLIGVGKGEGGWVENLKFEIKLFMPWNVKGALSSLRQFLVTESPLKTMKNAFYWVLKALLVLKIFKFLSWIFSHVEKRLD